MAISNPKYLYDEQVEFQPMLNGEPFGSVKTPRTYLRTSAVRRRPRPSAPSFTGFTVSQSHDDTNTYSGRTGLGDWEDAIHESVYPVMGSVSPFFNTLSAAQAAWNRALGATTGDWVDLSEHIFEYKQTYSMVSKRTLQVVSIAKALRQGNFKRLGDILKGRVPGKVRHLPASRRMADGWLELQFGWLPLVSDVYGAISNLHSSFVKGTYVIHHAGIGNPKKWDPRRKGEDPYGGIVQRATVIRKVTNTKLATLNALGLTNPLLTAWNLLPYSFVVDWFLPVSSFLAAASAQVGFAKASGCYSYEQRALKQYTDGITKSANRTVTRSPKSGGSAFFPTWNPSDFGAWKVATSISLLRQQFGRR